MAEGGDSLMDAAAATDQEASKMLDAFHRRSSEESMGRKPASSLASSIPAAGVRKKKSDKGHGAKKVVASKRAPMGNTKLR